MLRSIWDELDNVNRQVAEALPIRRWRWRMRAATRSDPLKSSSP